MLHMEQSKGGGCLVPVLLAEISDSRYSKDAWLLKDEVPARVWVRSCLLRMRSPSNFGVSGTGSNSISSSLASLRL